MIGSKTPVQPSVVLFLGVVADLAPTINVHSKRNVHQRAFYCLIAGMNLQSGSEPHIGLPGQRGNVIGSWWESEVPPGAECRRLV